MRAVLAAFDMTAQRRRSATLDRRHDLELAEAHTAGMGRTPSRPAAAEEIRRFLIHVLPDGFHRIRHYGLFANANRANNIALARRLLGVPDPAPSNQASDDTENAHEDEERKPCPCCGGRMIIVETFEPGRQPRRWPFPSIGLDDS